MSKDNFDNIVTRSIELRKKYHKLELLHHGSEWTVEEDALAYLTDAGLIGRTIMSEQKRWPKNDSKAELEHKLGENIWWLIVLAERSGIDIKQAVDDFLAKTENLIG
ncbi:MazG-like protein [Flavobacterium sp. DG1-102-2]|uniref:MazG-like protein n=1 Tax=Flavobacterium sp. DG1-102-2 TaxID=3081663 RepID=UPI00294A26C7|nr:MazG-like protein [Flavobacterium sp. DG1-102-2]MDV6167266.1 MazG-like protein [Flavobacterium sp. DG1-102-2]